MRMFTRFLWILAAFGIGLGSIYYGVTQETTGAVLLWVFGVMPLIVATWITLELRGAPVAPEDDTEADPGANAGTVVGSFPSVTLWPLIFVLGVVLGGAGLIYGLLLVPPGLAIMGIGVFGLMSESRN